MLFRRGLLRRRTLARLRREVEAAPQEALGRFLPEWQEIAGKLRGKGVHFPIELTVRFRGEPGEQATMFFADLSSNALEIKAFASDAMVFAR